MRYQIMVHRLDSDADAIYEQVFDANEDTADEIGERAGNAIEEAIRCDVAAQVDSQLPTISEMSGLIGED